MVAVRLAFEKVIEDRNGIPVWLLSKRTVLIPIIKYLRNYYPITCLNTSYKLLIGLVTTYIRGHAMESNIWDVGQLEAKEGVLGTAN